MGKRSPFTSETVTTLSEDPPGLGYHFTCQICVATYCYIHLHRHDGDPRVAQALLPA